MSAKEHGGGGRVGAGGRQGRRASGAIRRRALEVLQAAARWSGRAGGGRIYVKCYWRNEKERTERKVK
jgi:hypothetical protein